MSQPETNKQHWLGRPPEGATNVERWTGSVWVIDDGEPGLSFSGEFPGTTYCGTLFPYAWGPDCECFLNYACCPKRIAMSRTCDRFHCSNGGTMVKTPCQNH